MLRIHSLNAFLHTLKQGAANNNSGPDNYPMAPLMVNGNDNEANGTVLATQNGAAGQSTAIQADAAIEIGNHAYQMPNDFAAIAFQQLEEYF